MAHTIELLETIGKNAALRHAPSDELVRTLEQRGASDALKAAVRSGNSSLLSAELGNKPMKVNHDIHTGGHEEGDESEHDHGDDDPDHRPRPDESGSVPNC